MREFIQNKKKIFLFLTIIVLLLCFEYRYGIVIFNENFFIQIALAEDVNTVPEMVPDDLFTVPETVPDDLFTVPEMVPDDVNTVPETVPDDVNTVPEMVPDDVNTVPEMVPDDVNTVPETVSDDVNTVPEFKSNIGLTEDQLKLFKSFSVDTWSSTVGVPFIEFVNSTFSKLSTETIDDICVIKGIVVEAEFDFFTKLQIICYADVATYLYCCEVLDRLDYLNEAFRTFDEFKKALFNYFD